VLDPLELSFGFTEAATFRDVESGRDLIIDPGAVREEYLKKIESHLAAVTATCAKLGIVCHRLVTNQPLEIALFGFLQERLRRGRQVRRGNGGRR
jgi:hypothetical protein